MHHQFHPRKRLTEAWAGVNLPHLCTHDHGRELMLKKLVFVAGLGIGFVLGARAGRERYEKLKAQAQEVARNPKVQDTAEKVTEQAKETAKQASTTLRDKLSTEE